MGAFLAQMAAGTILSTIIAMSRLVKSTRTRRVRHITAIPTSTATEVLTSLRVRRTVPQAAVRHCCAGYARGTSAKVHLASLAHLSSRCGCCTPPPSKQQGKADAGLIVCFAGCIMILLKFTRGGSSTATAKILATRQKTILLAMASAASWDDFALRDKAAKMLDLAACDAIRKLLKDQGRDAVGQVGAGHRALARGSCASCTLFSSELSQQQPV